MNSIKIFKMVHQKKKERKKCVAWPKNIRKLKSISSDQKNWGASIPTDDQNWSLFSMQIQPGNSAGSLSGMVNPQMDFQWPAISDPTFTLSVLQELLVHLCESWRLISLWVISAEALTHSEIASISKSQGCLEEWDYESESRSFVSDSLWPHGL